ncbi:MAG: zinc ribbon domain-containing protein [Christensenellales bacterium]
MLTNKKAPSRTKADEDYLLTTKLFCGDCGRLMAGECGTSGTNSVKYYYYKCGGANASWAVNARLSKSAGLNVLP